MVESKLIKILTVPMYLRNYFNNEDLFNNQTHISCPLPNHMEKQGKSFSYMPDKNKWSCFGKCKLYNKDVIDLHMYMFRLQSREFATTDLVHKLKLDISDINNYISPTEIDYLEIDYRTVYSKACSIAKLSIALANELDYIMSFHDTKENLLHKLNDYCNGVYL